MSTYEEKPMTEAIPADKLARATMLAERGSGFARDAHADLAKGHNLHAALNFELSSECFAEAAKILEGG